MPPRSSVEPALLGVISGVKPEIDASPEDVGVSSPEMISESDS